MRFVTTTLVWLAVVTGSAESDMYIADEVLSGQLDEGWGKEGWALLPTSTFVVAPGFVGEINATNVSTVIIDWSISFMSPEGVVTLNKANSEVLYFGFAGENLQFVGSPFCVNCAESDDGLAFWTFSRKHQVAFVDGMTHLVEVTEANGLVGNLRPGPVYFSAIPEPSSFAFLASVATVVGGITWWRRTGRLLARLSRT